MSAFFIERVNGYDRHMLTGVESCKENYIKLAELVSENTLNILNLDCDTGLELDEIFKQLPDFSVVGIDLAQAMLDKLKQGIFTANYPFLIFRTISPQLGLFPYISR